jgi:hypothetical protein
MDTRSRSSFGLGDLFLLVTTAMAAVSTLAGEPLNLSGWVKSTEGPVLTNATVFIYTAGPRVGVGYI